MRVLHVAEAFGGGLLEVVRALSDAGVQRGHHVAIAYGVRPETPTHDELREQFDERVELIPTPWTDRTPGAQFAAARELRRFARAWDPTVVHLHSSFAGVVGTLALGSSLSSVFSPHAYASALPGQRRWRTSAFRLAERIASRRATVVGAVSYSEARVARSLGARRIEVVENGIPELDPDCPVERELPQVPRVVGVGRTVPQRQPVACARILSRVADVVEVAWIGGGGGARGEDGYAALAAAGIRPSGWLPRDAVLEELRAATAYLHWTSWDGQPLSILEAMAQDAVVVASDIEPNREILGTEQVCPTEDGAVAMLRRIVGDPEYASMLQRRQRERRDRYGARRMVEEWFRLYAELSSRAASQVACTRGSV